MIRFFGDRSTRQSLVTKKMKTFLVLFLVALIGQLGSTSDVIHLEKLGAYSGQSNTTRYWDCCKPTCSWSGNTAGSTYVKSCASNGVTIASENTQSGCETSGSSYVCNSNMPWAVNSSFAFGFIAAAFNKPPTNMCCACLLLKFQKGGYGQDLTGKQMVVQVTNTGGTNSPSSDHNAFDIMIPGGGVGYYTEGCKRQWGSPSGGWGDQYGGCETESCCYTLPTQLQAGCLFRWNWMGGASNPPVTFEQVTCPSQLTEITGCS